MRGIKRHNRFEPQPRRVRGRDVGHDVATCGLAEQRDAGRVHLVLGGVHLHPADGVLGVLDWGWEMRFRRQPVVDGEPGEVCLREDRKQGRHVRPFVAAHERPAVDDDDGRERSLAIGDRCVERQAFISALCVFNVCPPVCGDERRAQHQSGKKGSQHEFGIILWQTTVRLPARYGDSLAGLGRFASGGQNLSHYDVVFKRRETRRFPSTAHDRDEVRHGIAILLRQRCR